MNIFKLFGEIAISNTSANEAIDETTDKAENSHPRIKTAFEKIGTAATAAGKVIATGLAAGSAAIGALAKASLGNYAEYEQLTGGIETLFGSGGKNLEEYAESVGKSVEDARAEFNQLMIAEQDVMNNANNAYKTAGLSANEYMETVTSFSASLLQGLGGDTVKAAAVADRAITDMSDNANKMGTDISMIQNAYQGFAKQNYTMLDNLKLGYGGTQSEMARLINDSGVLGDTMVVTAETVNSVSFDKIIEAIGVVQDRMGITGTTAAEASSTIEGSLSSAKSAWQNLLTGFADGNQNLDVLLQNLVTSVTTAANNIVPRLAEIFTGISTALAQVMPVISEQLPVILSALLPGLISGATGLMIGLISALPQILQLLIEQLPGILTQIGIALTEVFPILLETVKGLFSQIWNYISLELLNTGVSFQDAMTKVQEVFNTAWTVLQTIWQTVGQPIFDLIKGLVDTVKAKFEERFPEIQEFVNGCFTNIKTFWEETLKPAFTAIGEFIDTTLAPALKETLGAAIDFVVDAFFAVSDWISEHQGLIETLAIIIGSVAAAWGLVNTAITLWNTIGAIATAITTGFGTAVAVLTSPITLVIAAVGALIAIIVLLVKNWDKVKETAASVWEGIKGIWGKVTDWFKTKIVQPISNLFTNLWKGIKEAFKAPINWIIDGINSFIRGINKIQIPEWVPLVGGMGFNIKELPRLEKGGILEKGQVGLLEGNGAEAVVPLDQNQAWVSAVARDMQGAIGGTAATTLLEQILAAIKNLDEGLAEKLLDAFASMKFDVNNREFARMVKAVN